MDFMLRNTQRRKEIPVRKIDALFTCGMLYDSCQNLYSERGISEFAGDSFSAAQEIKHCKRPVL